VQWLVCGIRTHPSWGITVAGQRRVRTGLPRTRTVAAYAAGSGGVNRSRRSGALARAARVVASRVLRLADLPALTRTDAAAFTPPPRFGRVDFAGYRGDHPSQAAAKQQVQSFASACVDPSESRRWWPFARNGKGHSDAPRGLYLDGGFGVGKTHLLAAAYAHAPTRSKRYVSFQQLVHVIGVLGMPAARERLGRVQLLCLDEFELDDPGNTLIVKTFLSALFEFGGRVVTTSNTPPEAQGQGRFNASDFRREIQSIAERFTVLRIDGPDARAQHVRGTLMAPDRLPPGNAQRIRTDWPTLLQHLRAHHPARYRAQLESLGGLVVSDARVLGDQNDALRFVHFVDTLYDLQVPLWLAGAEHEPGHGAPLIELFDPLYRHGAYAKKYFRCASRLAEIGAEAQQLHERAVAGR